MSSSYGPIIRFKQLTRNIQNGFWQYYIREGRSRVEMRSRCPCVVLVLSADSSNHRQRRAERGADFLLVFGDGWRFDPTATRLEIKCTSASLSSPGRDLQSSCRRNWFNSRSDHRPAFSGGAAPNLGVPSAPEPNSSPFQ